MDPITLVTIWAGIVAILGFLYPLFIGQKSLFEWWRERQEKREASPEPTTLPRPKMSAIPNNLPPRSEFIGREKEKVQVGYNLPVARQTITSDGDYGHRRPVNTDFSGITAVKAGIADNFNRNVYTFLDNGIASLLEAAQTQFQVGHIAQPLEEALLIFVTFLAVFLANHGVVVVDPDELSVAT